MEFIRIDDNTVRCIVNEDDMREYDVELDDFLKNRSKVQEFLHTIVERASDEVGYEPKDGLLAMQIMMLPKNRLAITFSEKMDEKDDLGDIIQQLAGATIEKVSSLKELFEQEVEEKKIQPVVNEKKKSVNVQMQIYVFDKMNDFEEFSCIIPDKLTVKSSLYKDEKKNQYYAILEKGRLSKVNYSSICTMASEYGRFVSEKEDRRAFVEEHFSCLILNRAIKVIKKINKVDF
ncbi:adaptor protein MecA [[Clostridium] polysaccharolyticum]|uniref:Adapter protein MecA 1/2 n=1 Tax=[Clostridium] polysaccharolyticum TaxID=29364 RepID=A0A1I0E2N7_9FIRM|nr:adaptor protein MecA [[Clostridium] polysaccharolyticum]SET38595.1 adapter protein MecA 1/2 [[Clostridium] polysaccharolyticum]